MLIEKIELLNIKSYDDEGDTVTFRPGVNLIWGKNGSGKTTILEAIGYCLFDALEYNLDQFRREGETEGKVILTFKHSDERSYAVIREIRLSGGLKIQDVESGRFLFKKRKDAEDWLNDELGVEFGQYGKHLFQNAIGVSQGKMVGAFVVPTSARKKIFDPILRVDEYDLAYKQLAETRHYLNDLLKANQIEQSHLKGRLEQLPSKKKDHQELADKILAGEREIDMMQEQSDSLQDELTSLDQILSRLVELDNTISSVEHHLSNLSSQLQTIGTALEESQEASEIVAVSEKGHKQYEQAHEELAILETHKHQYDQILKDIQDINVSLSGLAQEIADVEDRLDEVGQAERKLSDLGPEVQKQSNLEEQIVEAKEQVKERERLLEEISSLQNQIAEKKSSLETLQTQVLQRSDLEKELQGKTSERKKLLSALDANRLEVSEKQSESESVTRQLQQALLDKHSLESASKQRDDLISDIEIDQADLLKLKEKVRQRKELENELEAQEREKSVLSENLGRVQQEVALCKHKIDELEIHLSMLRSAESAECPTCRRPLSEIEKNDVETDFVNDELTWSSRLQVAQAEESTTSQTHDHIEERLNEIQSLLRRLPTELQVEEQNQTIKSKEDRLNDLQKQINLLSETPKIVEDLQFQADQFDRVIKDLKDTQDELEKQRSQLDQKIDQLQRDIAELPSASSGKALETEIRRLEDKVKVKNSTAEELASAEQDLQTALAELGKLGDPRTEQYHLYRVVARRLELEKELASSLEEKNKDIAKKADLENALLPFANLDQEMSETKSILRECEQDHKAYERNLQTAQSLGEREASFENLQQQHIDQTVKLDQLVTVKNQVNVGYDPAYHQETRSNFAKLEANINSKSTRLDEWQKQLELLNTELSELDQQQEELERVEAEVCRIEKLSGIFDFVRNSIKRASPDIVRRRVQAVSQTADRIFQDILGDLMLTLVWDESYAVNVRSGQKERVFEQLSGGEQMAASIAVRLALLLHMADNNIRWLFLDEPTANMDDIRRDKLADRITRLDQLDQIFVITHDDAFDRDTHHLIEISKLNGVSIATSIR